MIGNLQSSIENLTIKKFAEKFGEFFQSMKQEDIAYDRNSHLGKE